MRPESRLWIVDVSHILKDLPQSLHCMFKYQFSRARRPRCRLTLESMINIVDDSTYVLGTVLQTPDCHVWSKAQDCPKSRSFRELLSSYREIYPAINCQQCKEIKSTSHFETGYYLILGPDGLARCSQLCLAAIRSLRTCFIAAINTLSAFFFAKPNCAPRYSIFPGT
jgi:hypothetical protein